MTTINRTPWTPEEVVLLRTYGPTSTLKHLRLTYFQDRTETAIRFKLTAIGVDYVRCQRVQGDTAKVKVWKDAEMEFIRAHPEMSFQELAQHIPGRTVQAIRVMSYKKGYRTPAFSRKLWTKKEELDLMGWSEHYTPAQIAKKMDRTWQAIRSKMLEMGLRSASDCMSLRQISTETGYDVRQIQRAKEALGQSWKSTGGKQRKRFNIASEQYEALIEYLRTEEDHTLSPEERFRACVDRSAGPNGCWVWKGAKGCKDRFHYFFWYKGKRVRGTYIPERYAWRLEHGSIPNRPIRQLCPRGDFRCVNPAHYTDETDTETPHLEAA